MFAVINKIVYGNDMLAKMPMAFFAVDKERMKRRDDFRFENRIKTRSEAIRRLIA